MIILLYFITSFMFSHETVMHTFLEYNGYNDDASLNFSVESYEDLTKSNSDRYEFIYPNITYAKDLEKIFNLNGLLNFEGRGNRNLIYHEILARTIASLDEDQKKKFHKRLNFFISSLDKIIKNQK